MLAEGAHVEGPDGPLHVLGDDGRPCEGEGKGFRGWAGGAKGMKSHPGEEVWPNKEASRRGKGADGGTEESA